MLNRIKRMVRRMFGRTPSWSTNQLMNLGASLAGAFGFGVATAKPDPEADTWTTEKLVNMGESLSHIHPGI